MTPGLTHPLLFALPLSAPLNDIHFYTISPPAVIAASTASVTLLVFWLFGMKLEHYQKHFRAIAVSVPR